jgi:peptidyl-prolyl cis-trans isomerase SurA
LKRIIDSRIQLQQAEREKVTVDDAEITEQIDEIMKKVNAKICATSRRSSRARASTLDAVKKRIRETDHGPALTRRKSRLRVSVTEQEIDRYLDDNRDKLEIGLSFEARTFCSCRPRPRARRSGKRPGRKAEEVYALLKQGQDFSELAQKYSEDASGKDGAASAH